MPGRTRSIAFRRLIVVGFFLFTGGAILTGGMFPLNVRDFNTSDLLNWCLLASIRDAGAVLVTGGIIISGIRSIQIRGNSRRRIAMVVTGIGIGLLFLTLNSIAAIQMDNLLKSYDFSRMIALIESKLRQEDLPTGKRRLLVRKLAESRYLQGGERILVPVGDDRHELYDPPPATVDFKKTIDSSRQLYGLIRHWSSYLIYVWIGVLLFSAIAGAVTAER